MLCYANIYQLKIKQIGSNLKKVFNGFSFINKLSCCLIHSCSLVSINLETLNNVPFSILNCNWETVVQAFWYSIGILVRPSSK